MPPTVFISYSHKDEVWKNLLVTHLAVLEKNGRLCTWDDRLITAGQEWLPKIEAAMKEAHIAVLLVSADFFASPFIQDDEFPYLLGRRAQGLQIMPVIVRDSLWEAEPRIACLQVRPQGGKPLAIFRRAQRETELKKIAKEIQSLLNRQAAEGTEPEPVPAKSPDLRSLRQLPPPPADFTGREAELADVRAAIESGSVTVAVVRGAAGIGKTAFVLKLARELVPLYSDAQIFLDLQGASATPLTPAQAMAHVIRAFQPENLLPESETELAELYQSVLRKRRVLLLMDNAAGPEQVEPLVPPEESLLLVTSRKPFHLPGLLIKDLDKMPSGEAQDLLLQSEPRIGEQADRIAGICGGLPFALEMAAGALAHRPRLSPADYAQRLAEEKERLGLVDASLKLSYDQLSARLSRRWSALAVFPASFDISAASAVWDLELTEAEVVLRRFVWSSLVEWKAGRYRLHDLARVFAHRRASEEERAEAERRHAVYYRDILVRTNDLFLLGGPAQLLGLRLIDQEWVSIQAGQAWAAEHLAADREATELAASYPNTSAHCLGLRLRPRERIGWLETALRAAQLLDDRREEGRTLGNLGRAYADLGETHHALGMYEKALGIAHELGDRREEGVGLNRLGTASSDLGAIDKAIEMYEQALVIVRELGDRREEGVALNGLGLAYGALSETRRAIELHEQYLAIARDIGDRRGEGFALNNLGVAYAALGETRRAIELYEEYLTLARDIGDRRGEGATLNNLGLAYATLGETRRAIEMYDHHLAIARDIGDRRGESIACWNLGLAFEKLGELDRVPELMQVYVDYEREIGHPDAEKHAAKVEALRARLAGESPLPGIAAVLSSQIEHPS